MGNHLSLGGQALILIFFFLIVKEKRVLGSRICLAQVTSPLMASWIRFQNIKAKQWVQINFHSTQNWFEYDSYLGLWYLFICWLELNNLLLLVTEGIEDSRAAFFSQFCTAHGSETEQSHVHANYLQQATKFGSFLKLQILAITNTELTLNRLSSPLHLK